MKPSLTVACFHLKSAWQAVCRPFSEKRRRLSSLRYGFLRSALTVLLIAPLASLHAADAPKPVPPSWSDDFSDAAAFAVNWRPYGFLATGIDAKHPLGKTVSGKDARPDWWQIVDGALRGQCFPEEKHPPGLRRPVSGKDIRVSCRFKLAPEGQMGISVGGPNPVVEKDFNVAGLHIRPDRITAWDNDVLHPKGSPEAAELKKQGIWNRKFIYAKTEKISIDPDIWHDLVLEMEGKELRAIIDGKLVLTYTTLCGDVPKHDIGLQPGGKSDAPLSTWFDDIRVAPLP
jgi:hypothetical protein